MIGKNSMIKPKK